MNIDIEAIFGYLNDFASAILPLFSLFGVIAGLYLLGSSAKMLITDGRGGQEGPNLSAIGIKVFIAGCLLQFSTSIEWTTDGLLAGTGKGAREAMALIVVNTSPVWDFILKASFLWLAVFGVAGVFRGFLKWNKAGSGESQHGGDDFWAGLWHIIGGAILINIGTS